MRPAPQACIIIGVLTCAVVTCALTYRFLEQPPLPEPSAKAVDEPEPRPLDRVDVARESEPRPLDQNSDPPSIHKDEARLPDVAEVPAEVKPEEPSTAQDGERTEIATGSVHPASSAPSEPKQNLSYLAYYAYSELPPDIQPADTVLDSLKAIPPGTPVDEIKNVTDLLGLDFTFMKAVAKIESNFDPKQRTGSYMGVFQLSLREFRNYGSGDIFDPRDNTVAAALKFMTESILFESFTHKKPTLDDMYLVHQQGIDGATEHVSHPDRLAWQSMCATNEGKEKGEKWCKRAIWGNTLPAIKRVWKNVNKVTSAAFVGMWQERVSHFYARYSAAAAN